MFSELGASVQVQDSAELADALGKLFCDRGEAEKMGSNGRTIVAKNRGALRRLLKLMEPLISKVQEEKETPI